MFTACYIPVKYIENFLTQRNIMRIHPKKLREAGFSHVEIVLVVVVIAVVVLSGFIVYAKHSKQNTAHAGGWTLAGVGDTSDKVSPSNTLYQQVTAYVCLDVVSPSKWVVRAQAINANTMNKSYGYWAVSEEDSRSLANYFTVADMSKYSSSDGPVKIPPQAPTVTPLSLSVNPKVANFIYFYLQFEPPNKNTVLPVSASAYFTKDGQQGDTSPLVMVRPMNMARC